MTRFSPHYLQGLTDNQIKERIEQGQINHDSQVKTKSVPYILFSHLCTLFNAVNLFIALALLSVSSYRNMLFCGVVICNLAVGIFQEIRAKLATDRLSLISSINTVTVRNGKRKSIQNNEIVLDDILFLSRGDSIACDCIVVNGTCEVNESLVTGESEPVYKSVGDTLISGSFVVSGSCYAKAERVGNSHYASKISAGAKYIKKNNSQIMKALNTIIRVVTVLIFPIGALLFSNMHFSQGVDLKASIESTSAAIIGMIPEGLILLVSTVLAVSVIRLSKKNVLVQDLYCIESLARVDTLCLDKTGTITEGKMILEDIIYISERDKADKILQRFTSCASDSNPTFDAIIDAFPPSESNFGTDFTFVPFSSSRKYSALKIDNTTYYLGAGDILCPDEYKKYTADFPVGKRIIALCCEKTPMCFLVIKDIIKKNAKNILEYFKQQGVDIKIISGDSPETVSAVAKEAGVPDSDKFIDASTLSTLSDYSDAVQNYTIFGRVTPDGKEQLIKALQNKKHTVAMTGDGVNDVLALKAADCSIAMANGSSAARNVSHIILLDSDFASLPDIVCEGRRSINNIRRSASMFLVKTLFTIMLSLIYLFFDLPYPFIPIQLTLISTLTIGIPSFILALEPSRERVGSAFLSDIFKNAFPAAFCVVVNILILTFMSNNGTITNGELSTISTFTTGFSGLYLLFTLCTPFNRNRTILWLSMSISFYTLALLFGNLFEFVKLTSFDYLLIAFFAVFTIILFNIIQFIFNYLKSRIAK